MVSKPRWPDNSRIFLGNLVPQVQDSVIRAIFSKYGPIAEIGRAYIIFSVYICFTMYFSNI
jgi:RNA recognition motif-containing protein